MAYENLIFTVEEGIAIITLNRPHRLNALSLGLLTELDNLLTEIEKDEEVRVVILAGSPRPDGRPCFSAGGDIKEMAEAGTTMPAKMMGTLEEGLLKTLRDSAESCDMVQFIAFNKLATLTKPTIAAVDGICTAGGLELALCCDLRIVAETAQICDLHVKNLGVLGGGGIQTRLPQLVGPAKAKEMMWTGHTINGKEAWRIGLANQVVPSDKLMEKTKALAKEIAGMRPLAVQMVKTVINASLSQGAQESLRFSAFCQCLLRYMSPQNMREGFKAFVAKRSPTFGK